MAADDDRASRSVDVETGGVGDEVAGPDLEGDPSGSDGSEGRRRFGWRAAVPIAVISFAAGAMVGGFLGSGGSPLRVPAEPNFQGAPVLALGEAATSSRGNSITALSWDGDAHVDGLPGRVGQALVLWCAGIGQQGDYGRIAELWRVELADESRVDVSPSDDEGSLLQTPHLVTRAGDCMRGTVEFRIPEGAEPTFLQFGGQEIFKWDLAAATPAPSSPAA